MTCSCWHVCLLAEAVKVVSCGSGCPWHWTWWTGTQNFTLRCYISSGWSACASSCSMGTSLLINSSNDYHFFFFIYHIMYSSQSHVSVLCIMMLQSFLLSGDRLRVDYFFFLGIVYPFCLNAVHCQLFDCKTINSVVTLFDCFMLLFCCAAHLWFDFLSFFCLDGSVDY